MTVWFHPNLQETLALVVIIISRLISEVYHALKLRRAEMYAVDM